MSLPPGVLAAQFPNLRDFVPTSPETPDYNCHAWGADEDFRWWEPGPSKTVHVTPWIKRKLYWPLRGPWKHTIEAFQEAHATVGFEPCDDGTPEVGFEKIAHYGTDGRVTHTARQLPWGTWTSKLGANIDIEHRDLAQLEGPGYGSVVGFMKRPVQAVHVAVGSQLP